MTRSFPHPIVLIISLMLAFYAEARQTLPDNDDSALLQRVTHVSVDEDIPFWDFSAAEAAGSPVEVRFALHGDSISVMLPGIRHDFILRGDTVLRSATETRFIIMSDTIPMPYASLNPSASLSARYASRGAAYHSEYIDALGEMSLSPVASGTLVLPMGDTIPGVTLTRLRDVRQIAASFGSRPVADADSVMNQLRRTTVTYSWLSPDFCIPLAQLVEVTDSIGDVQRGETMVSAWICVPENQPLRNQTVLAPSRKLRPSANNSDNRPGNNNGDIDGNNPFPGMEITVSDNNVTVRCPASAGVSLEIVLTDIVGRVYPASVSDGAPGETERSFSGLPSGQYLLYVSDGSQQYAQKLILP